MAKLKKRADGRYQRKITLSDGRQKVVYGRTLAELAAAEQALRADDQAGLAVGDRTLVGEWAKVWLATYKQNLRAATVKMYRSSYNNHIMAALGGMELREVKPVHIRTVMAGVADRSESLQHKVLLTMRQMFEAAKLNGLILRDPTDGVKTTPHARPQKKKHLAPAELQELTQAPIEPRARVFCALCLLLILRPAQRGGSGAALGRHRGGPSHRPAGRDLPVKPARPRGRAQDPRRAPLNPHPCAIARGPAGYPAPVALDRDRRRRRAHDPQRFRPDVGEGHTGRLFPPHPAHAAPHLRDHPLSRRRRSAHRPAAARPQQHPDDGGYLHPSGCRRRPKRRRSDRPIPRLHPRSRGEK